MSATSATTTAQAASGAASPGTAQDIVNGSVSTYRPNVVLLMAGANDLIQNPWRRG